MRSHQDQWPQAACDHQEGPRNTQLGRDDAKGPIAGPNFAPVPVLNINNYELKNRQGMRTFPQAFVWGCPFAYAEHGDMCFEAILCILNGSKLPIFCDFIPYSKPFPTPITANHINPLFQLLVRYPELSRTSTRISVMRGDGLFPLYYPFAYISFFIFFGSG